jgi:hypothetical protein
MDTFQRNTVRSFRKVKEDIRNLQAQITDLGNKLEDLMEMAKEMKAKESSSKTKRR